MVRRVAVPGTTGGGLKTGGWWTGGLVTGGLVDPAELRRAGDAIGREADVTV